MSFTPEEIAYIRSQPLARIATVDDTGQPDATPVGYQFDGTHFVIGGYNPTNTRRARNVRAGHTKVALIIDDLPSTNPWTPRYLRIYGTARLVDRNGHQILQITPTTSWSMNLSGQWSPGRGTLTPRKTDHTAHQQGSRTTP